MVYVFGIFIPVMELMLVYSAITVYIIILVFLEIRKLRKYTAIQSLDVENMKKIQDRMYARVKELESVLVYLKRGTARK